MRRQTFFILSALAEQPRHGYGVILRVEDLSEGEVRLGPGTVYGALDRLQEEGLVVLDREELESGRQRRYYRLTDVGRDAVAAELERLQRDVKIGRTAIGGAG